MNEFQNILFVSQGLEDETSALMHALFLARKSDAEFKILVVRPNWTEAFKAYEKQFELSLVERIKVMLCSSQQELARRVADETASTDGATIEDLGSGEFKIRSQGLTVPVTVKSGSMLGVQIIQHVLRDGHDLVVKRAEPKDGGKGFKAIDLALLRKCPCPVFLIRLSGGLDPKIKVGVAIDPESSTSEGNDLSLRLLREAGSYAKLCATELRVVACWDYDLEGSVRGNPWLRMPDAEVDKLVATACNSSRSALDKLLHRAGVPSDVQVHHLRGDPSQAIPEFVESQGIDILMMGTVGRTGIPGFIIGNTAENIVQKLECSLMAFKPNGFVSPVKAY